MHLSELLWALPRPSTPNPLFSERGQLERDDGLCMYMRPGGLQARPWPGPWTLRCSCMACSESRGVSNFHYRFWTDPEASNMHVYEHVHTRAFLSARLYSREEGGAWLSRTIRPSSLSHLWEQGFLTHWGPPTLPVPSSTVQEGP